MDLSFTIILIIVPCTDLTALSQCNQLIVSDKSFFRLLYIQLHTDT